MKSNLGTLYLIPCPIVEGNSGSIPLETLDVVFRLRTFIVERAKTARRYIKSLEPPYQISELEILELDKHNQNKIDDYLKPLMSGTDVGLISEAGCPCIADPGGLIVARAHELGIRVVPHVGPSSILLALMASGMNGQGFTFHGYLPVKSDALKSKIRSLEKEALRTGYAQIFMETPYRQSKLTETLTQYLQDKTRLCIAQNINGPEERILTKSIKAWKKVEISKEKELCIFIISA